MRMQGERRSDLLQYLGPAVLVAALVLPFPHALDKEAWQPLFGLAHVPVFAALGVWVVARFDAFGVRHSGFLTLLMLVGLAVIVELVQPRLGRHGDPADALAGITGAVIAITGWRIWKARRSSMVRSVHALLSLGLVIAVLWPSLLQIGALWWQARSIPMLGDFESSLEQQIWRPYPRGATPTADCPGGTTHGGRSLALGITPGVYSGVRYQANDRDWGGYDRLALDIYLPSDGPGLSIRIDDDGDTTDYQSRFNQTLELKPGWNRVSIPLAEVAAGPVGRSLNLGAVRQLLVYAGPRESSQGLFCLDHVRLE
jgi:VanZ family protein